MAALGECFGRFGFFPDVQPRTNFDDSIFGLALGGGAFILFVIGFFFLWSALLAARTCVAFFKSNNNKYYYYYYYYYILTLPRHLLSLEAR